MKKSKGSSIAPSLDLTGIGLLVAALNSALVVASLFAIAAIALFVFGYVKTSVDYRAAKTSPMVESRKRSAPAVSDVG